MADLKDEIKLVANADGVETGVSRAKRSLATLGQAVDQVGEQGERGFKRFGAGSDEAGRRIDSTTKGMVSSLQRQIAALEAGGTATRQYQESIARLRGADMNVLKPYLDQLDAAKTKAEGAAKANQGMEKSMGTLGTAAGFLRAQMVALVGSFTFAAGVAYVRQMTDALDALNDVKDATGASIENISALENVAMRTGTTLDVVTTSMVKLNEVLNKAKPGSDQALALKAIGLEAEELRKLDPAEALRRVAVALSEYADDGNKARLVQGFFSKSIREMAPFLADLAEQTQLVGKVTSEQTAEAEKFNKQLFELKTRSADAGRAMVSGMLPGLNQIAEAMNKGAKEGGLLLGVYRAIAEFGSIAFGTDKLGKELSAAKDYRAEMTRLSRLMQGPLLVQERDPENDANNRRVASLRAQLEAVQKKALQATDAIKGLVDPPKPPEAPEKPSVVAPEDAATLNAALNDALAARLQAYKNNDKAILDNRKAFYDTLGLLTKLGTKSELDAVEESLAKEEEVWAERKANFTAELAEATKKKNSQAEIARITGQMQDAERDYYQTVAKLRADATLAEQKYSDALADRISKQLAAAGAAQEQVRLAQLEGKAIGLTGDALREHNQLQVEDKARRLEALALWASGVDASGKLAQAYLDEAAALRKLHTEQGANRSAQLVNEYVKGIEDSNKLLQAELGLMGQSEQARNTALEQLRIQLDLEKKIAEVKSLEGDTPERAARIAQLEAGAAIAKANAANKAFLDEWKTSVGKYDDIFRQGFADMLNNGKNGWKSFTKSLATTFKTTVADQLYKAFAQPFVVNIVGNLLGLLGGGASAVVGGAAAAASGGSALSGLGTLASGASLIAGNFGAGLTTGLGQLMSGNIVGGLQLGTGLIGSGATAGGLGTIMGVLGPIALGVGALMAIAKATKGETRTGGQFGVSFDGTVTNQRRGQTYTYQGQQFDRDFSNGQRNALIAGQAYRLEGDPVQNEQAIRDAVSGTASGINAFLKALGSKATLTGFSAGLETSSKGRGGVFAGGILSDGITFGESGKGDNYAGTLYEKFSTNSPDFKTALENFTLDLKQSTIQALQSVGDIPQTVQKMLKGVDAEALSEEAANALLESINAQILGVQNLTSAFEAMGLDKLAQMGFDAASGLAAAAGGFDKLQTNLNTYYDNFYTDEQKRANLQKQLDKQFAALGIDVPKNREEFSRLVEDTLAQVEVQDKARASLSQQINDAVAGAGKDGFTLADAAGRSIVSGINPALLGDGPADPALAGKLNGFLAGVSDLAAKGLDPVAFDKGLAGLIDVNAEVLGIGKDASKTAATLLALSGTFAQLNESADDAAARIAKEQADARDKALRGLERAIAKEKEALQSQIDVAQDVASTMSGLFDLLKSNVQELYGEVDSTRAMLAVQGNDFITQALATARTTGYLPDETQLADAISAARGGLDQNSFGNSAERDYAALVLAGKLSELEGLTGKQLTSAELTVKELESQSKQLDKTLDYWKEQIEIANGTYEATLSVTEAIKTLEKLMFPDKGEIGTLKPQQVGGVVSGGASFGPGYGSVDNTPAKIDPTTGKRTFSDGSSDYLTENELDLYRRGILGGVYASTAIPKFDVGTNYVPRDMLAQIHEGEAIVPKAFNPWANGGATSSGDAELIAEVRALREEVRALRVANEDTADASTQTAQVLTRVTQNGNGMIITDAPLVAA
ncbi:hypothetical protein J2W88_003013 [Acidovorax delafieldii]|uniref:Tail length tape measure protein n=1 Tax=Acidovorax delafieldii TaxID=47920 RepID=A0AAJ2F1X2_ACIDE|nr:hypothetical protein [Acidovorax delafieldii]MDR6767732.1 hypothetical protein [Acidovorax delafieldii]MDR6839714.1 hypothetical protein [Acidovorax delafieldii]MDR7368385.1 hypothetical protein [Acidovorax delafieldii]